MGIQQAFERGEPIVALCRRLGLNLEEELKKLPIRMAEHAVSIRHVFDFWPQESFRRIWEVQQLHDDGLVDVCQGKVNNHFVLYAIPRKRRDTKRRPWFTAVLA